MADFNTTPIDTISLDTAGDLDAAWRNAGMPDNGLRIYGHRISGNRTVTLLAIPGDDSAPCYTLSNGRYIHVSGPTLAQWEQAQRANEIDAGNAAHYRSLAAESRDPVNVAVWTERADFYAQRAASR